MFSPNGVVPSAFWPDEEGATFKLKESLKPLEPFKDRTLILHGVCDKVRGDGDNHMRGMGCLLTGIELFPGNIQGGSDTPAGWAKGLSIDQEIKNSPAEQTGDAHPVRLAGVRRDGARTAPTPGPAWSTPARTSRSRRSTIPTRCSPSSTAG